MRKNKNAGFIKMMNPAQRWTYLKRWAALGWSVNQSTVLKLCNLHKSERSIFAPFLITR